MNTKEKAELRKIIKSLKGKVKACKDSKDQPDAASWGYQEGVLISWGTASQIIEVLKKAIS